MELKTAIEVEMKVVNCAERKVLLRKWKTNINRQKCVQNDIQDCDTGLDECKPLFSDRYEMIANPILRSLFWIMGFVALFGNLATNILTLKEMIFHGKSDNSIPKGSNFVKVANSCFIFKQLYHFRLFNGCIFVRSC